jgi:cell division protein FtsB
MTHCNLCAIIQEEKIHQENAHADIAREKAKRVSFINDTNVEIEEKHQNIEVLKTRISFLKEEQTYNDNLILEGTLGQKQIDQVVATNKTFEEEIKNLKMSLNPLEKNHAKLSNVISLMKTDENITGEFAMHIVNEAMFS